MGILQEHHNVLKKAKLTGYDGKQLKSRITKYVIPLSSEDERN